MKNELTAIVAAIRSQPWAIIPEYLEAIEAMAARAIDDNILKKIAQDGHVDTVDAAHMAIAAVGTRLEGTRMSTVRDGVAVVPMIGAIFPRASMVGASTDGTSLDAIMRDVRVAEASDDISRGVLLVDSPGGVVSGLGEAAAALRATSKPWTAFVTGNCASAAYWLASQADEIVMDTSAAIGSIGVVASLSRQETPDANGRRSYEVVSAGAPLKRPDPSTEEGRAAIQQTVDALEETFIADVAAGRKVTEARVRADFGQGSMLTGPQAIEAGMADRLGTLEALLSQKSGRTRPKIAVRRAQASAEIETRRAALEN